MENKEIDLIEEAYIALPKGFKANGVAAGLKSNATNINPDVEKSLVLDVCLVESDVPANVAGVYTSNLVKGHSLTRSIKKIDMGGKMRAMIVNSKNANAAVVDVHHLVSLPVNVLRGIYHDPVNEFVDQVRRQLFDLGELLHLVDEPLQILRLVRLGLQIGLHFGECGFQLLLLLLVGHGQGGVAVIGELALGVVLVELLDQPVDLGDTPLGLVQIPPLFRKLLLLVLAVTLHLLPSEIFLKYLHVFHHPLHTLQHQIENDLFPDIMGGAHVGILAEGGAEEVGTCAFVVVGGAVIQFLAAVGTVEEAGEGTDDPGFGRSAPVLSKLLHQLERLPVDDCRVGIREHLPFLLRSVDLLLVLEGTGRIPEVDCVAAVFLLGENVCYRG